MDYSLYHISHNNKIIVVYNNIVQINCTVVLGTQVSHTDHHGNLYTHIYNIYCKSH